jgi:hypothetical protein
MSNIFWSIRGQDSPLEFLITSKRYNTYSGTIVASLESGHAVVLKKLKM